MENVKIKLFTLEEANSLIPRIKKTVSQVSDARTRLAASLTEIVRIKKQNQEENGSHRYFREKLRETVRLHQELAEYHQSLMEQGLVVRDYNQGIIDFPTIISGIPSYFCWHQGEENINHWHRVEQGEREPITQDLTLLRLHSN